MKLLIYILLSLFILNVQAQKKDKAIVKFEIGVSFPELTHIGVGFNVTPFNQIGIAAGLFPGWGETIISLSIEHRLYVGRKDAITNRRMWFCRQSVTHFGSDLRSSNSNIFALTVGADLYSRRKYSGFTIDGGITLYKNEDYSDQEKSILVGPAIRIQYYFFTNKESKETNSQKL